MATIPWRFLAGEVGRLLVLCWVWLRSVGALWLLEIMYTLLLLLPFADLKLEI